MGLRVRGPFAKGFPAPLLKVFIAFLWARTMRIAVWCVADSGGTKARAFAKQKRRARIALRAGEDNRPTGLCIDGYVSGIAGDLAREARWGMAPTDLCIPALCIADCDGFVR